MKAHLFTGDGSYIDNWAKMSSKYSYDTPYVKGQFHYYQNLKTGQSVRLIYKLTNEKVLSLDTNFNFIK